MVTFLIKDNLDKQRWWIAFAAILIQLCLGTIYSWSVIKNELVTNQGWQEVGTSLAFVIALGVIGFAAAVGGILVDKKGPRFVATLGGLLFGIGTIIAGVGIQLNNLLILYLGYGLIAGLGNGFGYVTPIATLIRWFPDKRGLVTGLAVMGFGAGSFFIGLIAPYCINNFGVPNTFYLWGICFLILIVMSAQLLINPPQGWLPLGYELPTGSKTIDSYDFHRAIRASQWWILWGILFVNVSAGLGFISQLSSIARDLYYLPSFEDLSPQEVSLLRDRAGSFVVAIAAIFNGLGRLFWAWLSDIFGRKAIFSTMFITQAVLYLITPYLHSYILFVFIACYLLSCLGGGFATMPAFAADTFGSENIGRIYGAMLTAWGSAGVMGPFVFSWIKDNTASYNYALYGATGLLIIGFILTRLYHPPRRIKCVGEIIGNE
ncbi:Oxalate/formate antiporter [Cyanobacterium sp. HL-69]|uniref:L-lactate MFS transporter n=1 Tax=Cyanobacterium sp. HL-69 TaxID=2054282 RepID=UPI000CA17414|nr:Oxalate/formate antiporter [Cyanobacterium sp. HL-69]